MAKNSDNGFSILEVLVALAVLAIGFLPLMALQAQHTRSVIGLEVATDRLDATMLAVEVIDPINPMLEPSGVVEAMNSEISWTSSLVEARKQDFIKGGGVVGLYDMEILVTISDGSTYKFSLRKLGWATTSKIE